MEFHRGDLAEFEVRFARMASAHAAEVGALGSKRLLPAMRAYRALEQAGKLLLFYAYSEGQPAGYQAFIVTEHPHYAGTVWAQADAVYVKPEHRGILGARFMAWADEQLREAGVQVVLRAAPRDTPLGSMLERMDYREQETNYIKEL